METKGSAATFQAVSGNLEQYTVWCSSPNAVSDPDNATAINLRITGDIRDVSQKNFELLIQAIGLRASPVILQQPVAVADLTQVEAQVLTGQGFRWCFATERADQFNTEQDPVALLTQDLHGIVLANGATLVTQGAQQNIEFRRKDSLC